LDIINISSKCLQKEEMNLFKAHSVIKTLIEKVKLRSTAASYSCFKTSAENLLNSVVTADQELVTIDHDDDSISTNSSHEDNSITLNSKISTTTSISNEKSSCISTTDVTSSSIVTG
jgi:hypothetical protein